MIRLRTLLLALAALSCVETEFGKEEVALESVSPDGSNRILLVEKTGPRIDRNFSVVLKPEGAPSGEVIFRSPDEGRPVGTERFIWSADSTYALLVGKHFCIKPGRLIETEESEALYFLFHVPSGRSRCNASQQTRLAPFGVQELQGIRFGERFRVARTEREESDR